MKSGSSNERKTIFITGGTGYIGSRLIKQLIKNRHRVVALVRKGSENKVPAGAKTVAANPFDAASFQHEIPKGSIFIQLLGTPHPSPKKAALFKEVDLVSVQQSVIAARNAEVSHFVYLSVALEPSSIMKAYQEVGKKGEELCKSAGFNCTIIRPWYVLGPGHWWPVVFLPLYAIAKCFTSLRTKAKAFELVTIRQMLGALVAIVETQPRRLSIVGVNQIKHARHH